MPAISANSNKPAAAEKKIKAKKKLVKKTTRPAPKTQPGPFTNAERKKVERNEKTPKYQKARQQARKHGPATRRGKSLGEAGKSDEDFRRGREYVRRQYIRKYGTDEKNIVSVGADKSDKREGRMPLYRAFYKEGTTVPPDVARRTQARKMTAKVEQRKVEKAAPVLKALDQTTRPLHAVAAGTRAAIKGKNVPKAAKRGLELKDRSTFSDVLKDVGVDKLPGGKVITAVAGFGLDVVLDPTTYATFGTGAVAKQAAAKAGAAAAKRAIKQGLSKEQARRMGEMAARQAAKKADGSRGVTVRFAGKEAPGVRDVTAKAGKAVKGATDKPKVLRAVKEKARHLAADVNPGVTPDNISREGYREVRRATRTARSKTAREIAKTKERAASVKKLVNGADQEVLDAIESGSLRGLSPERRAVAKRLRDQFKYARRLERQAGIPVKERKGYVPHQLKEPEKQGKKNVQAVGAKKITPSFSKARKEQRTLADIRRENPDRYQENAAVLYANRLIESHVASNKAGLNRRLLDMGRKVRKGDDVEIGAGEKVFNVKGSDIREVTDRKEMQRFVDSGDGGKGGQYVILNEQTVDRAVKNVIPASERTAFGEAFDKIQGGWKWLATVPNIGFHLRNLVGDAQNAYLAEGAGKLAVNTGKAAKVLKAVGREEEHLRKSLPGTPVELKGKGVKVDGKKVSYHDLIREAENVGAIRAGFINREIPELTKSGTGIKKVRRSAHAGRSVKRFIQNREDLFRLATYIGGRNKGLSPEKAAERAARYHFDYADLTQLERTVLRRVAPFYTFSARNIPLQLTSYFTRPGKFAQYQKIRLEFAKAFGIDLDENEQNLTEFEQRSAPVPIKWKGEEFTISFGPSGLPLTDLNELPMSSPSKAVDEWFQRAVSLMSPGIKTPLELGMNYSFFFRDQLERDEGPLVPAPSFVGKMPEGLRDKLGIVPDYVDKRTGRKGWGWPAKVDYMANLFPGPFGLGKRLATESDRQGESTGAKLVAGSGVRVRKVDSASAKIGRLYDEKAELSKKRASLNQRGIYAANATPEWRKLSDRISEIDDELEKLRRERGDVRVPKRGRPVGVKPLSIRKAPSSEGEGLFDKPKPSSRSGSSGGGLFD